MRGALARWSWPGAILLCLNDMSVAQSVPNGLIDYCDTLPKLADPPLLVASQADADHLAPCTLIPGSILISSPNLTEITLNGITTINGDLWVKNCPQLTVLTSNTLGRLRGGFGMRGLPELQSVKLRSLTWSREGLILDDLPKLNEVSLSSDGRGVLSLEEDEPGYYWSEKSVLSITGTALTNLDFLSHFAIQPRSTIEIRDNMHIASIPDALTNSTHGSDLFDFRNNHWNLTLNFSQEEKYGRNIYGNITIGNVRDVFLPHLQMLRGTLRLQNNYFTVVELPALTFLGESLYITDNGNLTKAHFPRLTSVGSESLLTGIGLDKSNETGNIVFSNNNKVAVIDGFNKLKLATRAMNFTGEFSNLELPALFSGVNLSDIRLERMPFDFFINTTTTYSLFDCTPFDNLRRADWDSYSEPPKFKYNCTNSLNGSDHALHSHTYPWRWTPKKEGLSPERKIYIIVGSTLGVVVVAALLYLWLSRRKRKAALERDTRLQREARLELDSVDGVHRAEDGDRDGLPTYSRVPKPGEVPPGYRESEVEVPAMVGGESEDAVTKQSVKRKWWAGWRK